MDFLTFIVEVLKAVAWPATVVAIIYMLKGPISDLVPFLEELKYKDFALRFRKKLSEAKEEAPEEILKEKEKTPEIKSRKESYLELANISPRSAILESWRFLEDSLLTVSKEKGLIDAKKHFIGHSRIGHGLLHEGVISKEQFKLFHRLRELRNQAAHAEEFSISYEDVVEYIELAMQLSAYVEKHKNT